MKDGVCSKCQKEEVFLRDSTRNEFTIALGMFGGAATEIYVCAGCGFVEIYARSNDLAAISQKLTKVERR